MKVLILGPYTIGNEFGGGAENHTKNLIDSLKIYDDLELNIITISGNITTKTAYRYEKINIYQIRRVKIPMTIAGVSIYPVQIINLARKIKPDLIHGQMVGAPYGLATAILSRKYPTILTVHTLIEQNSRVNSSIFGKIHDFLWRLLENWEIKQIPHFISVSPHLENDILLKGGKHISIIPNGINSNFFNISDKTIEGRILFVGRISPIKGIYNLIKSIRLIVDKGYTIQVHLVGKFENIQYKKKIIELITKLELTNHIKLKGGLYGNELLHEYTECSLFVLPSMNESNPIVLLEAMATGKPVISTNVGGVPYIVEDGINGLLVNYGDIEDLAEKIIILLSDKKKYIFLSENGRKTATDYNWEKIAGNTYNIYEQIYKEWNLIKRTNI